MSSSGSIKRIFFPRGPRKTHHQITADPSPMSSSTNAQQHPPGFPSPPPNVLDGRTPKNMGSDTASGVPGPEDLGGLNQNQDTSRLADPPGKRKFRAQQGNCTPYNELSSRIFTYPTFPAQTMGWHLLASTVLSTPQPNQLGYPTAPTLPLLRQSPLLGTSQSPSSIIWTGAVVVLEKTRGSTMKLNQSQGNRTRWRNESYQRHLRDLRLPENTSSRFQAAHHTSKSTFPHLFRMSRHI